MVGWIKNSEMCVYVGDHRVLPHLVFCFTELLAILQIKKKRHKSQMPTMKGFVRSYIL